MNALHKNNKVNLFWFRRDLRLADNHGLYRALAELPTICCFIWDPRILSKLKLDNPRVNFIEQALGAIKQQLQALGSDLIILHGEVSQQLLSLSAQFDINAVYVNEDYEPLAIRRDQQVAYELSQHGIELTVWQDQVICAKQQLLAKAGTPYTVYTPYKKAWLSKLKEADYQPYPSGKLLQRLHPINPQHNYYRPSKNSFTTKANLIGNEQAAQERLLAFYHQIEDYRRQRDYPALNATSYLGVDLRFGTISIRQLVGLAVSRPNPGSDTWLSELIWREFFSQILYNFPHVVDQPFRREYQQLEYQNKLDYWQAWCQGQTGYPIVDAGMRQLNQSGFMHNRVRMICASFLCKDLLIDWRWGEAYFAEKLLDYDLASNNGNWQWCASTGCDAQPYFRIFNPYLQSAKFDPQGVYLRRYLPELAELDNEQIHCPPTSGLFSQLNYPPPIVNHQQQANQAKIMFANIRKEIMA